MEDVTNYKQMNVDFQVWKNFYDYHGNENDIDDSIHKGEYLKNYKTGVKPLGRNTRGLFIYYYKQIQ